MMVVADLMNLSAVAQDDPLAAGLVFVGAVFIGVVLRKVFGRRIGRAIDRWLT